jgi:hypothetical protein
MVQEAGIAMLVGLGVRVMTSRGEDLTDSDDEMRVAMRLIVGVFSQLEKTRLVKKLKAARDRKKASGKGRYIGRKSHVEKRPAVVALAKRLYRANPKTGERRSLREISGPNGLALGCPNIRRMQLGMNDGRGYPVQLRSAVCRCEGETTNEGQSSNTDSSDKYQRVAAKCGPTVSQPSSLLGGPIALDHASNGLRMVRPAVFIGVIQ